MSLRLVVIEIFPSGSVVDGQTDQHPQSHASIPKNNHRKLNVNPPINF